MRAFHPRRISHSQGSTAAFWLPTSGRSFALVTLGAALWGTDPLFRRGLALAVPAPAIVLVEQALPALLVAPLVAGGLRRAWRTFGPGDWVALVVLGCGASALATLLFTLAFAYGSPTTPVLLQQLQPLFAVAGARLLLGERLRRHFVLYLAGGLAGAYLIAFADPTRIGLRGWIPALLTVTAAGLWGFGTVLGRRLGAKVRFGELTALRLFFGLIAAGAVAGAEGDVTVLAHLDAKAVLALVLLSLFPGLFSLLIYYRGLRGTPASAATLGELAFPLTTLIVSYLAFHSAPSVTQWLGVVLLTGTMTVMGLARPGGTPTGVEVPDLEKLTAAAMVTSVPDGRPRSPRSASWRVPRS
jgi:drug/metabolite transporter (DMT)-like permease